MTGDSDVYGSGPFLMILFGKRFMRHNDMSESSRLLFTNRASPSVQGNAKPDLFVRPELAFGTT